MRKEKTKRMRRKLTKPEAFIVATEKEEMWQHSSSSSSQNTLSVACSRNYSRSPLPRQHSQFG